MIKTVFCGFLVTWSFLSYGMNEAPIEEPKMVDILKMSTSALEKEKLIDDEISSSSKGRQRLTSQLPKRPSSHASKFLRLEEEGGDKAKGPLHHNMAGILMTVNGFDKRVQDLESENERILKRLAAMERNIGALAGSEPVYYRLMRADLVLQLTVLCTLAYATFTAASGDGVGDTIMAILSAYMFYGFFKFVRDAGTVVGNVVLKRPN